MGSRIFTFFVSVCFETSESVDFNHFLLFQFVSVSLIYNLYVSMILNTGYGVWNFQVFMFQFVSKCLETIESVDLEIFSLFQFVSVGLLHIIYMFQTPDMGSRIFTFFVSVCFEMFRNK